MNNAKQNEGKSIIAQAAERNAFASDTPDKIDIFEEAEASLYAFAYGGYGGRVEERHRYVAQDRSELVFGIVFYKDCTPDAKWLLTAYFNGVGKAAHYFLNRKAAEAYRKRW